jgi:hypothetical protein
VTQPKLRLLITLFKLAQTTASVHITLFTGVGRMAFIADVHGHAVRARSGLNAEFVAAAAGNLNLLVCWMDISLHASSPYVSKRRNISYKMKLRKLSVTIVT